MKYKNVTFNPFKTKAIDIISHPENQGLEYIRTEYINRFEAVVVFRNDGLDLTKTQKETEYFSVGDKVILDYDEDIDRIICSVDDDIVTTNTNGRTERFKKIWLIKNSKILRLN